MGRDRGGRSKSSIVDHRFSESSFLSRHRLSTTAKDMYICSRSIDFLTMDLGRGLCILTSWHDGRERMRVIGLLGSVRRLSCVLY